MMTVVEADLVPIIVALLIGIAIGWWMYRTGRTASTGRGESSATVLPPPPPMERADVAGRDPMAREGRGIADQGAAATKDDAGQIFGVEAHPDIPGPSGPPDNLQILKGVGPKLALRLNENGIYRFDQLARLSPNEIGMLDERMGPFKGRIARDRIVEQSAFLARDDREGFEAKFGKLGGA